MQLNLYYWVTVRNSQSYWHLEHMGKHWHVHGAEGGVIGWLDGGGANTAGGGVCVSVSVGSGIFSDVRRATALVF